MHSKSLRDDKGVRNSGERVEPGLVEGGKMRIGGAEVRGKERLVTEKKEC